MSGRFLCNTSPTSPAICPIRAGTYQLIGHLRKSQCHENDFPIQKRSPQRAKIMRNQKIQDNFPIDQLLLPAPQLSKLSKNASPFPKNFSTAQKPFIKKVSHRLAASRGSLRYAHSRAATLDLTRKSVKVSNPKFSELGKKRIL